MQRNRQVAKVADYGEHTTGFSKAVVVLAEKIDFRPPVPQTIPLPAVNVLLDSVNIIRLDILKLSGSILNIYFNFYCSPPPLK